jgi:hypothetical protein
VVAQYIDVPFFYLDLDRSDPAVSPGSNVWSAISAIRGFVKHRRKHQLRRCLQSRQDVQGIAIPTYRREHMQVNCAGKQFQACSHITVTISAANRASRPKSSIPMKPRQQRLSLAAMRQHSGVRQRDARLSQPLHHSQ